MKAKKLIVISLSILAMSASVAQDSFSSAGITIGGTSNWYWRLYRPSSGALNQSLIFAQTGSTSTENIRARLTQWGGLSLGTTNIGTNQMLAVAGDSYFGGPISLGTGSNYLLFRDNVGGTNEIRSYGLDLEIETRNISEDILFNSDNGSDNLMIIKGDGSGVGIGTNPTDELTVNGIIRSTSGLRMGGVDIWYWRVYRDNDPASAFNQSLLFARKMNESSSETIQMRLTQSGALAVGTTDVPSGYRLAVDGNAIMEEVKVEISETWPDYVFEDDYELRTLEEVEAYIDNNRHLPEIPSEAEVNENGIKVGEMNAKLLQKIEELTLYLIEQNKEIQELKEKVQRLEDK